MTQSRAGFTELPERNLDVMRALAALSVVVSHVLVVYGIEDGPRLVGGLGVLLFFVHTALVLMGSMERLMVHGARLAEVVMEFYLRRFARIYPLVWVTVLIMFALQIPPEAKPFDHPAPFAQTGDWKVLLANLLLVEGMIPVPDVANVLWTLIIELQMYLVLPFCWIAATKAPKYVWLLLGIGAVGNSMSLTVRGLGLWRLGFIEYAPCFLSGVLAYAIIKQGHVKPTIGWKWWLPLICLLVGIALAIGRPEGFRALSLRWPLCLAVGLLIPRVMEMPKSWLSEMGHTLARYSYGLYLTHTIALVAAFQWLEHESLVAQWGTLLVLLVALPWLAYHFVEEPGIRLGRKLAERVIAKRAPFPAASRQY